MPAFSERFGVDVCTVFNMTEIAWARRPTAKMRPLGIETGADLRRQTLEFPQAWFGKAGHWYIEIARGHDRP
jgi:nucleotidyltransferase/DNA polymerase involved in DNA repair